MQTADFLVVGAGVAGLSAAARLAAHGHVVLIEAENALGYHSSGRSATFSHYGIGNRLVRGLTFHSRAFFLEDCQPPLARTSKALFVATEEMRPALETLRSEMAEFTDSLRDPAPAELADLFPPLRIAGDGIVAAILYSEGLRLDSDALLQAYARTVRDRGGFVLTGARAKSIQPTSAGWKVETEAEQAWSAPILVNAAGAWADQAARSAGVQPLGLRPLRRTIIVLDPPGGADVRGWPFVKTVVDDFYILPESGQLMASPVDETESDPCDAQPEEYDVALAAAKVEQYTTLKVNRIAHRWAGLRTFTRDRAPAVGFDPDSPGFFWLAGQGGFGLQTAPALAEAVEAMITGGPWPAGLSELGIG
ncbi:MAG TPA: FAD-dependent oxidoreductase, partial [Allosphingosinicella sp.]|nr:FAD-dependent oxidoreductase [Allosphingosinicella sp.]